MSDREENDDIPDVTTCQALCEEFAAVTGTDTACAQFFLQDRKWDLCRSVEAYFDAKKCEDGVQVINEGDEQEVIISFQAFAAALAAASGNLATAPSTFKFISWNIDGLDDRSLKPRIKQVCNIINCELPDVVHLQELVPQTYSYVNEYLPAYKCIPGNDPISSNYFTATLLRKNSVNYESHDVVPFEGSTMGRTLLVTKVKIGSGEFSFFNSHLESTRQFSEERIRQLQSTFQKVMRCDKKTTVIFAGDLNLRDKELDQIGGVPTGLEDLWVSYGSKPELLYTWDGHRNTNIDVTNSRFARFRFDRIYLRHSEPSKISLNHFGLLGLEKIRSCGRFPSDHWGLIAHFEL